MENRIDSVPYKWVLGTYSGEKARTMVKLYQGSSIYKFNDPTGKGDDYTVTAYLKWIPADKPMQPHVQTVHSPKIIDDLEKWSKPWLNRK